MSMEPVTIAPWERPDPHKSLKMQDKAAFKDRLLEHNACLDVDSPSAPMTLCTIMCTISEKCCKTEIVGDMIANGMRIAKFDMCNTPPCDQDETLNKHFKNFGLENKNDIHTNSCEEKFANVTRSTDTSAQSYIEKLIKQFRNCVLEYSKSIKRFCNISIAVELKGPAIHIGSFLSKVDKIHIKTGEVCILTTSPDFIDRGTTERIFVDYYELADILLPNDQILLNFGRLKFTVRGVVDKDIICDVLQGGDLAPFTELIVVDVPLNIKPVTEKDIKDLKIVLDCEVDLIILPMVRNAFSVEEFRELLGERCKHVVIFIKIENRQAYDNFDDILRVSDGIIINRERLMLEMSPEKIVLAQKSMVARANKAGKPVYSVTEYLNTMIYCDHRPFSEQVDVMNAVIEGVDGIILVEQTAKGNYPVESVKALAQLCREAEAQIWQIDIFNTLSFSIKPPIHAAHATCLAAVEAAFKIHASGIFVVTESGRSAKLMARYKPRCPIFAMTRYGKVARILNLYKAILSIFVITPSHRCWSKDIDLKMKEGIHLGKSLNIIKPGDPLVMVHSMKPSAGITNNIRVVYASLDEPWIEPPGDENEVL